jgi:transcriptional regulator with XRE-family HTH domain
MRSLINVERAKRHMSQRRLAELSGISFGNISWWERGNIGSAKLKSLNAIAVVFDCKVDDLFSTDPTANQSSAPGALCQHSDCSLSLDKEPANSQQKGSDGE